MARDAPPAPGRALVLPPSGGEARGVEASISVKRLTTWPRGTRQAGERRCLLLKRHLWMSPWPARRPLPDRTPASKPWTRRRHQHCAPSSSCVGPADFEDKTQDRMLVAKAERGQQGPSAFRASSPLDRPFSPAMLANVVGTAVGVCAGVQVVVGGGLAGVIVVDDVEVLASGAARRQLFLMRV